MNELTGIPKILIADDNSQNVELLEAYLSDFECEIRTARDGEETLSMVDDFQPDLLLLDIMMPRLSGFEVCRMIRSNPSKRNLLILMVTALNEASDFERGSRPAPTTFSPNRSTRLSYSAGFAACCEFVISKNQLERTLAYLAEFETASRATTPGTNS